MKRIGPKAAGLGVLAVMLAVAGAFMVSANFAGFSASLFTASSTLGEDDKASSGSGDTKLPEKPEKPKPPDHFGPSSSRLGF